MAKYLYVFAKMLSVQIDKILKRDPMTRNTYIGCFAADQIPKITTNFPHCFCANTSLATEIGEHWIAIFVPAKRSVEYYDSFGQWPPANKEIGNYLSKFSTIKYNISKIQSEKSMVCGKHVIYFLHMRCKGIPFEQILERLKFGNTKPDVLVRNFMDSLQAGKTYN